MNRSEEGCGAGSFRISDSFPSNTFMMDSCVRFTIKG